MKARIISAAVGIALAAVILTLNITHFPWLINIALAIIACMSLYEILVATSFMDNKPIVIASFAATAFIQFIPAFQDIYWSRLMAGCAVVYFVVMFITLMFNHKKMHVERLGLAFMVTELIALPFFSLVYMYWESPYDTGEIRYVGQALVILCFAISWLTDTGALFFGMLFGKKKLAPSISPKKTVAGAIGGFFFAMASVSLLAYLLTGPLDLTSLNVHWINLLIVTAICSVASMIGDLSFSIIKRCFDIKDFGNIMPGHGGVLDRFDSVIFVAPILCMINKFLPVIIR